MKKLFMCVLLAVAFFSVNSSVKAATFKDLTKSNSHYDTILYLSDKNIISGYSDGTFKPSNPVTNRQVAVMIIRALNVDTQNAKTPSYKDVSEKDAAYLAIAKATELGIFPDGPSFNPDAEITRDSMARALSNAYKLKASTDNTWYSDVPDTYWAAQYIYNLSENNIATGYSDHTYRPKEKVTRAQFSSFLARAIEAKYRPTNTVAHPFKNLKVQQSVTPLSASILAYYKGAEPGSIREFSYDGGKYAAMEFNESLYAYDFTTNKLVANLGRHFEAFQANNEIVYVENDFRTIKIYNIDTKNTDTIVAHDQLDLNTVSLSANGRYLKFATDQKNELFVHDRKNKDLINVPARIIETKVDNPWDGDTFYFWGYTETELMKSSWIGGGMVEVGANQGIWSYNVKTGEVKQTKLQPRQIGWPANFTVNEGKIVLEDTNVYLYDIATEEITTVVTREKENNKTYIANVFFPSVSKTSVFYTYYGQIMQYDIATGKTTKLTNLKPAKPDPMDEMFSARKTYVNGDYLYILGNDVTFTVYRYR